MPWGGFKSNFHCVVNDQLPHRLRHSAKDVFDGLGFGPNQLPSFGRVCIVVFDLKECIIQFPHATETVEQEHCKLRACQKKGTHGKQSKEPRSWQID